MRIAIALLALLVTASIAAAQEVARRTGADAVTWNDSGTPKVRTGVLVESAGYDQVVLTQAGRRVVVPGADVVSVQWGDAPPEYQEAETALRAGDAGTARLRFESVLKKRASPRPWLVEEATLGLAESWLALARRDPASCEHAIEAFTRAKEANPRSLLLDRILLGLGRAQLLAGRADAATRAADDLVSVARVAKRPAWEVEAAALRANSQIASGDSAAGLRSLDEMLATAQSRSSDARDAETARRIRLAAAHALAQKSWLLVADAETSHGADAVERVRRFTDELAARPERESETEAAVLNTRGALLLLAGDAKKALRSFEEAEVLHFDAPEEAARAVRYEAECYAKLADDARRRERLAELADVWAGTEWSRRASR